MNKSKKQNDQTQFSQILFAIIYSIIEKSIFSQFIQSMENLEKFQVLKALIICL